MLPGVLRDKFINGLLNMLPEGTGYYGNSFTKKLRLFTEYVRNYDENGLASWYITFNRSDKERLYSPDLQVYLDRKPTEDPIEQWTEGRRKSDGLAEIMRADIQFYLPDDILAKVDRMSMAHSLEVRSPFLDHKFQEFAAVIPLDLKIKGGKLKYILKRAAKDLLPEDIINRSKHGFQVPVGRWFREELSDYVRDTLLNSLGGLFLKDYIKELLDQHQVAMRRDHGQKLWTLLILALWLKEQSSISQPF
jgi:asparagine synthase (glutamine-hydrolysing)